MKVVTAVRSRAQTTDRPTETPCFVVSRPSCVCALKQINAYYGRPLALQREHQTSFRGFYYGRPSRCGHIFALWFLLSSLFSSPNLSRRRLDHLDVYHTSTHGVASVRIYDAGHVLHAPRGSRPYHAVARVTPPHVLAIWRTSAH